MTKENATEPTKALELSKAQMECLCLIINTSEYCEATVPQLASSVKGIIADAFHEKISLDSEQEQFATLTVRAIQRLVAGLDAKLDRPFATMTKMPWATLDSVGDQSAYVNEFAALTRETGAFVAALISTEYFRFFCTKFVEKCIPNLRERVFKCRRVSEMGAQQLLLDAHSMKQVLLDLPTVGGSSSPASHTRWVGKEMGRLEALLKVLMAPPELEQLRAQYDQQVQMSILVDDPREFGKILELKGLSAPSSLSRGSISVANSADKMLDVLESSLQYNLSSVSQNFEQNVSKVSLNLGKTMSSFTEVSRVFQLPARPATKQ